MVTDRRDNPMTYQGDGRLIAYISGPITLDPDYKEKFARAERYLSKKGYIVLNPTFLPEGMPHDRYLPINDAMIIVSNVVFFMHGWRKSLGCLHEWETALRHDKNTQLLPKEAYR